MPLYCHRCKTCNHTFEDIRPMSQSNLDQPCPICGVECGRDYSAEAGSNRSGEPVDQFSEAAGVHPSQIAACKAQFPHHDFTPDGRMIFHGQRHKDRCLKDIGFVEHDRK